MQHIDDFFKDTNQHFILENVDAKNSWNQLKAHQLFLKKKKFQKLALVLFLALSALFTFIFINNKKTNTSQIAVVNEIKNQSADANILSIENKPTDKPNEAIIGSKNTSSNSTVNNESKNNIVLDNTSFYIDLSKEPEIFSLNNSEKNIITTKGGATIQIQTNALKTNEIAQNITMTVQEYYKKESNTGMIKYHFYKNDTLLNLETNNAITVQFPNTANQKQIIFYNQADNISDAILQKMQWASTEKFLTDNSNKVNYKITMPKQYNAQTFLSVLAFVNQKVLVAGDVDKNSIVFKNIPIGEPVYFISIGRAANSYFICNKKLITSNTEIKSLNFLETSQDFYTRKYEELSALSTSNQ
jgi:hypothetical protein